MNRKTFLAFLCAVVILLISICMPYFLLAVQDYSLFNRNVIQDVEASDNETKQLTTLQKIKFISYFSQRIDYEYITNNQSYSFVRELDETEIDLIYQEMLKLYELKGMIAVSKEDIQNYYRCSMETYQKDDISVMITKVFFNTDSFTVDLWFDNDTYQIYQLSVVAKQKKTSFGQLDVEKAFMSYLNIEKEDFQNFYNVYQNSYAVEVYINHLDTMVSD